MNQEEYDSFMEAVDRLIEGINNWKKLRRDFAQRLKDELIALSVSYFPELNTCRDQWVELLYPEIEDCSENILGRYEQIANSGGDKDKLTEIYPVPKPIAKEEADKFLQSELDKCPEKFHPEMIKWHEGTFAEDQFYDVFLHLVHQKMKEVLYSFFPEIIDFTGDQLRAIDGDIFLMGADLYKEAIRNVAREFIVERFEY
jgi:hypothetical protein